MMELKAEPFPDRDRQNQVLSEIFAALRTGQDFHLLYLSPEMFDLITFVPSAALVPVARLNFPQFSRQVLRGGYGGAPGTTSWSEARRSGACMPPA
jgi:hypothetical protein